MSSTPDSSHTIGLSPSPEGERRVERMDVDAEGGRLGNGEEEAEERRGIEDTDGEGGGDLFKESYEDRWER